MKRKLLGVMILYVLGVAILQNLGFSVFWREDRSVSVLDENPSGRLIGEVTGFSVASSTYIMHINVMCVSFDDVDAEADFGVLCYTEHALSYSIGDIVSVSGSFFRPEYATNPGQFNSYIYYCCRGTSLLVYQPEVALYRKCAERQSVGWLHKKICTVKQKLFELRCGLAEIFDSLLETEDAGMLKGMVLGDRSGIPRELQTLYQKNNISHILAISGLHIGLISGLLYGIFRRISGSYVLSGIVGMIITFAYGYMTGASDASMRAAIMLSISMVGAMLGRTYDLLTAMAISAMIMVTKNPIKLYDAGFLFSYGAIIGIGMVYPCLQRGLGLKSKLSKTIGVTLSVQLITLPISLHFYGTAAPYSLLLNLIVIPLVTPILIFGFAGGVFGYVCSLAGRSMCFLKMLSKSAQWMLSAACACLRLITGLCKLVMKLPLASVILGAMKTKQIGIYYTALLLFCVCLYFSSKCREEEMKPMSKVKGQTHGRVYSIISCSFLMILMLTQAVFRKPENQMTMLDVGQGDSILLQSQSGLRILVDGGSTSQGDVGSYVLQPALQYYGIRRLDYVVVTHADADHINGILYLLEQSDQKGTRINTLMFPLCCKDMEEYEELQQTALRHGVNLSYLEPGMELNDREMCITCLHPSPTETYADINDMSTVLKVSYGENDILLTGDIGTAVEERLLSYSRYLAGIEILKVAHHGSKYSTSEEFLRLLSPKLSLISCSANNRYGHPHAEVISRLEDVDSEILTTPENGAIEITFDEGWTVKRYR